MSNSQLSKYANFEQIGSSYMNARGGYIETEKQIGEILESKLKPEKERLDSALKAYNDKAKKVIESKEIKNLSDKAKKYSETAKSDLLKAQKEFKKICEDIDSQKWDNKKKADKKKEVFDYIISKLYSKEDIELFKKSMSNIVVIMPQGMSGGISQNMFKGMSSNNDNYHTIEI